MNTFSKKGEYIRKLYIREKTFSFAYSQFENIRRKDMKVKLYKRNIKILTPLSFYRCGAKQQSPPPLHTKKYG